MGSLYSFIVDYVDHEEFHVMEEASRLTNAPLIQRVTSDETDKLSLDVVENA
ncbi:MAG: hypothetical protein ACXAEX_20025 [Promethearchaeota archaeon]